MSLTPQPEPLQQAVFGNRHCNSTCFRHYRALSAAYFAARPRQCFERVPLRALSNTLRLTTYHELLTTNYQIRVLLTTYFLPLRCGSVTSLGHVPRARGPPCKPCSRARPTRRRTPPGWSAPCSAKARARCK